MPIAIACASRHPISGYPTPQVHVSSSARTYMWSKAEITRCRMNASWLNLSIQGQKKTERRRSGTLIGLPTPVDPYQESILGRAVREHSP